MSPRQLVWNGAERRPRAPVRLLAAPVVVVLVSIVIGIGLGATVNDLLGTSRLAQFLISLVSVSSSALGGVLIARYIDRRSLSDLGFDIDRDWVLDLGFGLVLGGVLMTLIFLVGVATDWVAVDPVRLGSDRLLGTAALFVFFVAVGVSEEILLRGVVLTNVAEGLRWRFDVPTALIGGLLISSAVFGVAHFQNPNSSLASTLSITLAGVLLGLGYVLTGDLAIPTGIHISWNFVQGGVYGFAVSGLDFGTSLIETTERGPDVITGGSFGPEAGLLGVGAMVVGVACIAWYVRFRYGRLRFDPSVSVPELRWKENES
ncbi:lysostaphin resistance A-like protein [Haloferax sp. S1W]|uniref:lysostaphin resistance A-like protein n=1 Tax=Haloferax sp. S1W TaxID=3377110 RepID=UPI0037CCB406